MKIRRGRSNRIVEAAATFTRYYSSHYIVGTFARLFRSSIFPLSLPRPFFHADALSFREFLRFLSRETHVHRLLRRDFSADRVRPLVHSLVRSFGAVTFTSTPLPTRYSHVAFALDTAGGIESSRTEGESLFGAKKTGRERETPPRTNNFIVTPLRFVRKRRRTRDDRARSLESISGTASDVSVDERTTSGTRVSAGIRAKRRKLLNYRQTLSCVM